MVPPRPTWRSAMKPGGALSLKNLHFGHCPLCTASFLQVPVLPQAACAATTAIGLSASETSSRLTHSSFMPSGSPASCQKLCTQSEGSVCSVLSPTPRHLATSSSGCSHMDHILAFFTSIRGCFEHWLEFCYNHHSANCHAGSGFLG